MTDMNVWCDECGAAERPCKCACKHCGECLTVRGEPGQAVTVCAGCGAARLSGGTPIGTGKTDD